MTNLSFRNRHHRIRLECDAYLRQVSHAWSLQNQARIGVGNKVTSAGYDVRITSIAKFNVPYDIPDLPKIYLSLQGANHIARKSFNRHGNNHGRFRRFNKIHSAEKSNALLSLEKACDFRKISFVRPRRDSKAR